MSFLESIAVEIVRRILNRQGKPSQTGWSPEQLQPHLVEVLNWSSRVDFFGLGAARLTDRDTISLLASLPRKFRGSKDTLRNETESDILASGRHLLILGDPGAGKTTTLKRLARIILLQPSTAVTDSVQYPIVVRLREIDAYNTLEEKLCLAFGLTFERETQDPTRNREGKNNDIRILVDKKPAIDVIAALANASGTEFLLDGMDEVKPHLRSQTEGSIVALARKCNDAQVILSCRSGDYTRPLDGFDVIELCPLEKNQVKEIVDKWCAAPADFLTALQKLPFRDLASRPLFLCELILLFDKSGFLPSQPATVYRRILLLALEEWDHSKPLDRPSFYSNFDPERKLEFLAHLAFYLTYTVQENHFTVANLLQAYEDIRENFDLPAREARRVVQELETHTGVLLEVGYERFEFSHLSIQEYLAAHYLVRAQLGRESPRMMSINQAPMAVSVAIAAVPTHRLASILLSRWNSGLLEFNLNSFFARLKQERAVIRPDRLLGFVGLALMLSGQSSETHVRLFLETDAVLVSIGVALKAYSAKLVDSSGSLSYRIRLRPNLDESSEVALPSGGAISADNLEPILRRCKLRLEAADGFNEDGGFEEFCYFINYTVPETQ